jgi:hypothetical protein
MLDQPLQLIWGLNVVQAYYDEQDKGLKAGEAHQ